MAAAAGRRRHRRRCRFRAGLRGSYFALITLAFAEVFRILAISAAFTGGGLGMLITAEPVGRQLPVRDAPWLYYLALVLGFVSRC